MLWWDRGSFFIFFLFILVPGCGYTLNHRLKAPFTGEKGIFVPVFSNNTEETGAERVFTNALIREVESRGDIVVSTRESGAMELKGTITGISYGPTAFSETGFKGLQYYRRLPVELGLTVSLFLALVDPKTGAMVWSGSFSGFRRVAAPLNRTYSFEAPSSVGLLTQSLIAATYANVARDIMRDVYDEMVELF